MGLLRAAGSALGSVLADQWREYFYCDALDENTLAVKGKKRQGKNNVNTRGSDNLITNGSIVAVADGQCMIIAEQGRIVEVCAEPGEFVFNNQTAPTVFYGGLGKGIADSFEMWKKRVTFGGDTATDQRVYYLNTKEIIGNKYGTANPVPFRIVDRNIGLDIDIAVSCYGEYAYRLQDPILFYRNVCGNITEDYTRDRIESQLRSELLTALQPAFAAISAQGVRYSEVPAHASDMADQLNRILSDKWGKVYGIVITSFGISSLKASAEDEERIKNLQASAVLRSPSMAAATLTAAQAEAMKEAAKNKNAGPFMAFAGMNMANQAGGVNAQELYRMGAQEQAQQAAASGSAGEGTAAGAAAAGYPGNAASVGNGGEGAPADGTKTSAGAQEAASGTAGGSVSGSWKCPKCGSVNTGNFCPNCGTAKPAAPASWFCPQCGTKNTGNFCTNCGTPRPQQ